MNNKVVDFIDTGNSDWGEGVDSVEFPTVEIAEALYKVLDAREHSALHGLNPSGHDDFEIGGEADWLFEDYLSDCGLSKEEFIVKLNMALVALDDGDTLVELPEDIKLNDNVKSLIRAYCQLDEPDQRMVEAGIKSKNWRKVHLKD